MSEKLSRFMQGVNDALRERGHGHKEYLFDLRAEVISREIAAHISGDLRLEDDWRRARLFLTVKIDGLREKRNGPTREEVQ